jgi:integrase
VRVLSTILTAAVEWGALPVNPALRIRLPAAPPKVKAVERILTDAQSEVLIAHAKGLRNETMIRGALEAGLRRGELVGLRWPDVLFDERRLVVRRSVWRGTDGTAHVRVPKAGRERRSAITEAYVKRLGEWYDESVVSGGAPAEGYVWPGKDGEPLDGRAVARVVERACKRAKLTDIDEKALVSTHRLRHTTISSALARGVPLMTVSKQVGHSDPRVTAQIYAHLLEDAQLDDFTPDARREGGGTGGGTRRPKKKRRG